MRAAHEDALDKGREGVGIDRRAPVCLCSLGPVCLELTRDRASNRVDLRIMHVGSSVAVELLVLVEQLTRVGVFKTKVSRPVDIVRGRVLRVAALTRLSASREYVDAQTHGEHFVLEKGVPVASKDREWFAHGAGRGGTPELEVVEYGIVGQFVRPLRLRGRGV